MNNDLELNECFDEMEKLKKKLETLELKHKMEEKNKILKKTTMEPNLLILETWLKNYTEDVKKERQKELTQIKGNNELEFKNNELRNEIFNRKTEIYKKLYKNIKNFKKTLHCGLPDEITQHTEYLKLINNSNKNKIININFRIESIYSLFTECEAIIFFVDNCNKKFTKDELNIVWNNTNIESGLSINSGEKYKLTDYEAVIENYLINKQNTMKILNLLEKETLNTDTDTYFKLLSILENINKINITNNIYQYSFNKINGIEPSDYMFKFIESTYNMFTIINNRIIKLEDLINKKTPTSW